MVFGKTRHTGLIRVYRMVLETDWFYEGAGGPTLMLRNDRFVLVLTCLGTDSATPMTSSGTRPGRTRRYSIRVGEVFTIPDVMVKPCPSSASARFWIRCVTLGYLKNLSISASSIGSGKSRGIIVDSVTVKTRNGKLKKMLTACETSVLINLGKQLVSSLSVMLTISETIDEMMLTFSETCELHVMTENRLMLCSGAMLN